MNAKGIGSDRNACRWYDGTSGMKRAYDAGMLDKKWIDEYCMNGGQGCVRKKRFGEEGYVSPDYVLPPIGRWTKSPRSGLPDSDAQKK